MLWIPFLLRVSVFASWFGWVYGLNFIVSTPTQCGAVRFTWVGGTPPFYALIIPPDGTIRNISVPANAWNDKDQSGDFSTLLALSEKQRVVFSMGDATGVTAGGVTDVMTVGPPSGGGQACNTTDPGTNFVYATDGTLSQCKSYPFTLYAQSGAIQPVTILVTVPHGESFLLRPPVGDSFNWQANLTAGTSVIFTMSDSQNRIGGTSSLLVVGSSDDSSCVRPLPSSAPPTRTPTPTSSPSPIITGGGGSDNQDDKNNSNTGIIIGAAVGGAVVLLLVVAAVYFFAKRKSERSGFGNKTRIDLTEPGPDSSTHLLPPGQQTDYPPVNPFPPYSDAAARHVGPGSVLPTTMYDYNAPTGSTAVGGAAAIIGAGAAGAVGAHAYQQYQQSSAPAPGAKQREAVAARQQPYQYQPYYNPFEIGVASAVATSSAYASTSSRQTAESSFDTQSQFGMGSTSNYSTSAGPNTASSTQKALNPAPAPGPRFIVHTDIEDEPIELPPMYSESRAPIPGMTSDNPPAPRKGLQ